MESGISGYNSSNPEWCYSYAKAALLVKGLSDVDPLLYGRAANAINRAYNTVYRAVAFDIDGTLTLDDAPDIDPTMGKIVADLLRRGVPTVLITGRGRSSARGAAESIRAFTDLSDWYFRRLSCITHNGLILLSTPSDDPENFLSKQCALANPIDGISDLLDRIKEEFEHHIAKEHLKLHPEPCSGGIEPFSMRVTVMDSEVRQEVEQRLRRVLQDLRRRSGQHIRICYGTYGKLHSYDISLASKRKALDYFAREIGVDSNQILRIGDQGQLGGNDYDLLNHVSGFSVGESSHNPSGCHPVLNDDTGSQLFGAEATRTLLRRVMLFPPLSLAATRLSTRLTALMSFEKLALTRARQESETVVQRLRMTLRNLLPDHADITPLHDLELSDLFDQDSGGIRFRDWELSEMPDDHPMIRLFGLDQRRRELSLGRPPRRWMYTDTSILMRGPDYYYAMTRPTKELSLREYALESSKFIGRAYKAVHALLHETPDLVRYKLFLALCDNIRNILLQFQYAAFVIEGLKSDSSYETTKRLFSQAVEPHTQIHYETLLSLDADWYGLFRRYHDLLSEWRELKDVILDLSESETADKLQSIRLFRRWRECDHFLQNVTAIQLGFHQLRQNAEMRDSSDMVALGLVYGGTELPAIARVVAAVKHFPLDVGFCNVSIYGNRETGKKIRQGKEEYVRDFLFDSKPLAVVTGEDHPTKLSKKKVILLDDNCTTCVTLQLARDVTMLMGADVVGSIIVRFPSTNRRGQMSMRGHGFPDPEMLFSFVRGLVAPSPYARLMVPGTGSNSYLDQTKLFDKSKARIERYLLKNGTPRSKE